MRKLTIKTNDTVFALLEELTKWGIFGTTPAEIAERFVCEGIWARLESTKLDVQKFAKVTGFQESK